MSEEQNEKKSCKCKVLVGLVIASLLMSIASLTMSIMNYAGVGDGGNGGKKVVISKKYDRGRSLDKAKEKSKPIMVFFYTDWCGFCQRFAPTYDKITKDKRIKNEFAVAFVNCEKPENSKHVSEFGITGFPTVYVIDNQGTKTQLDNNTFFSEDAKETVINNALKAIGK